MAYGIGGYFGHEASFFNSGSSFTDAAEKAVAHGVSRAALAYARGEKTSSAFWSGFASSAFSVGTKGYGGFYGRTSIMAVVGGTTSELTGGKFANGAVTGAFVHMFNTWGYKPSKNPIKSIFINGGKRAYQGAIIGASTGAVLDEGMGAVAGGTLGGVTGFAVGLVEGTAKEALSITYFIQKTLNITKQSIINSLDNGNYKPNNSAITVDGNNWMLP